MSAYRYVVAARNTETGDVIIHQSGGIAAYDTVCGISLSDVQYVADTVKPGEKINCCHCKEIWESVRRLTPSDFAKELK